VEELDSPHCLELVGTGGDGEDDILGCVVSSSESSRILEKYRSSRRLARRGIQESYSTRAAIDRTGRTNICRSPNLPGGDLNCIHVNGSESNVLKHGEQNKYTLQQVGHAPIRDFFDQSETASFLTIVSKIEGRMLEEDERTSESKGRRQESRRSPRTESVSEVRSQGLSFLSAKKY
jgi:hypothetical protein